MAKIHSRKLPQPPAHLSTCAKKWWREIVSDFELEPHHLRLLELAAGAWDRAEQARKAIEMAENNPENRPGESGLVFLDRFGQPHPRPELAVERSSMIVYARMMRELALDVAAPDSRPPATPGCRR